jgi:single-strand DNA-binding protein
VAPRERVGKQAEHCNNFLAKGRQVYVEGRLHTSSYDKDGQKHYKTEIVADTVQFIGGHDEGGASQERNSSDAQRRNGGNAGPREAGGRNGGGAYGRNGGNAGAGAGSRPSAPEPNFDDFGGAPGDDDIPF